MSEHDQTHDWDRAIEQALREGPLSTLRPERSPLDEAWMDRTLAEILGADAAPPRRRWKRLAVGATAVVLATGGVAAATGTAPDFVRQAMGRPEGHYSQPFRPAVTLVADVRLPGGGRFAAWRGEGQGFECEASADNWDGRERSSGFGTACGRIPPADDPDRDETRFGYTFSPDAAHSMFYPVVYGAPQEASVTQVRVRGELWGGGTYERLVPVDPVTHGFGVRVPGERTIASQRREWDTPNGGTAYWDSRLRTAEVDLLDAQGQVVRTVPVLRTTKAALDPALTSYDALGR